MKRALLLLTILLLSGLLGSCSYLPTVPVPTVSFEQQDAPSENVVFWVVLPDEHAVTLAAIPKGHFNPENHGKMWITVEEFKEAMRRYHEWLEEQPQDPYQYINGGDKWILE